jgi:hypothetical protein
MDIILPTTLVGSYPQPDWLIDRSTDQRCLRLWKDLNGSRGLYLILTCF